MALFTLPKKNKVLLGKPPGRWPIRPPDRMIGNINRRNLMDAMDLMSGYTSYTTPDELAYDADGAETASVCGGVCVSAIVSAGASAVISGVGTATAANSC